MTVENRPQLPDMPTQEEVEAVLSQGRKMLMRLAQERRRKLLRSDPEARSVIIDPTGLHEASLPKLTKE